MHTLSFDWEDNDNRFIALICIEQNSVTSKNQMWKLSMIKDVRFKKRQMKHGITREINVEENKIKKK